MRLDLDTITFKYDDLKSLDDSTVKDAINAAMVVEYIFTERFYPLEGRDLDVQCHNRQFGP